jgi:hypothetical protein
LELIWVGVTWEMQMEDGGAEEETRQATVACLGLCEVVSKW